MPTAHLSVEGAPTVRKKQFARRQLCRKGNEASQAKGGFGLIAKDEEVPATRRGGVDVRCQTLP